MKTQRVDNVYFSSLNNPVKRFKIYTPKGKLHVEEVRLKDKSVKFSYNISKFINDNFIDGSCDPLWKDYLKPENSLLYIGKNERYAKYLRDIFKTDDGNTTLLIAKDSQNNIKAAALSLSFNDVPSLKDSRLCSVDALAVDRDYRKFSVGKILMNKSLKSAQQAFTDAVLTGYNKAVPFYKKLGFEILPEDTAKKRFFYSEICKTREDIPEYTQIMYMPLQPDADRFYDRISLPLKDSVCEFFNKIFKL